MRRQVVTALVAGVLVPFASFAQPSGKVWLVGILSNAPRSADGAAPLELRKALAALGYVEGVNIAYVVRAGEVNSARLPALAAELVSLKVDLLVAVGTPAVDAAMKATSTIPIVIAGAGDAVGAGLIASLARPGGNVTGITSPDTELSAKRLELLKTALPKASRIAVIWNAGDRSMTLRYKETERAAALLSVGVQPLAVRESADFEVALASMKRDRPDAIFMVSDSVTNLNRKRILDFAANNNIPAMYERGDLVKDGGLLSYGPDFNDNLERVALYVDKIFKGAKAGDLPVEQPIRFYLRINLKTARLLGVALPHSLLLRADELIE